MGILGDETDDNSSINSNIRNKGNRVYRYKNKELRHQRIWKTNMQILK